MDLKTLLACFMGWHQRYRLADVKFTISAQTCKEHGANEAPRPKGLKKKDRHLKCLGWRTLREAFNALLNRYLLAA